MIPASKSLLNLADKIDGERERAELAAQLLTLTSEIQAALVQFSDMASLSAVITAVPALAALVPDHSLLQAFARKVIPVATRELAVAEKTGRWGTTALARVDYQPLLRAMGAPELAARIGKARAGLDASVEKLIDQLIAALANAPNSDPTAIAIYTELEETAPDHPAIAFANDLMARQYWREARSAALGGQTAAANAALAAGRAIAVNPSLVAALEADPALLNSQADPTAAAATVNAALASLGNSAAIAAAMNAFHAFERIDTKPDTRTPVRESFADAMARRADELVAAGDWEAAVSLTERALVYVPDSTLLITRLATVRNQRRAAALATQQQFVEGQKIEIDRLVANPADTREWRTTLEGMLIEIGALLNREDPWLVERTEKVGTLYLARARAMRSAERFAVSANVLERAARFAPTLAALAEERTALAAATAAFEQEQREVERQARIVAFKETFFTQTRANDVVNARKTLTAIAAAVGTNDDFVRADAPQHLARAHYR